MIKGMIFTGCSYTWGQGLYFYSNLPRQVYPTHQHIWDSKWITTAQLLYKDTLRYPRLVANHFNTFEVTRPYNGGNDIDSLVFLSDTFNTMNNHNITFTHDEISHIVIQLSFVARNNYPFEVVEDKIKELKNIKDQNTLEKYRKMYEDTHQQFEELTFDDTAGILSDLIIPDVERELKKYESFGIKTYIMTWHNEVIPSIKNNQWLRDRWITFNFNNTDFESINDLQFSDDRLTILTDYKTLGKKINDHHPSKLCHRVIADSVIKKIENDNICRPDPRIKII